MVDFENLKEKFLRIEKIEKKEGEEKGEYEK